MHSQDAVRQTRGAITTTELRSSMALSHRVIAGVALIGYSMTHLGSRAAKHTFSKRCRTVQGWVANVHTSTRSAQIDFADRLFRKGRLRLYGDTYGNF